MTKVRDALAVACAAVAVAAGALADATIRRYYTPTVWPAPAW